MFAARNTMLVVLILAATSPSAFAQAPASEGAVHMVSVTVPPRLKVDVAPLASHATRSAGLVLNVRGTQAWSLTVSHRGTSAERGRVAAGPVLRETQSLSPANTGLPPGSIARGSSSAELVLLSNDGAAAASDGEILLTVAAR